MAIFWKHVLRVIKESDIILEVLDARMIEKTRNKELENKVKKADKKLLYVINKCDLAEVKTDLRPAVYVSSIKRYGTTILKKKILEMARGKEVVVGVVGYPNVGKSSVINALKGRSAAKTSAESGFTRGLQKVRVNAKILLFDSPGVLPYKEKNQIKHVSIGAIDYGKVKDPEHIALILLKENTELIAKYYEIDVEEEEKMLESIALKLKRLKKGGVVDLEITARMVLKDWQTGKIHSS